MIKKLLSSGRQPRLPFFIERRLRAIFPKLYRVLKYGTFDATSKKYWDGIWSEEGLSTWRTYPNLYTRIAEKVQIGSRALDVGCGTGVLLSKLTAELKCHCFGVDISSTAIRFLKQRDLSGVVASLPDIPYRDSTFDVVIATEVLEHLEDPVRTVSEMKRVARPGGMLICSVPNGCINKEECDEHLHNFTEESLNSLLKVVGKSEVVTVNDKGGEKLLAVIKMGS